MVIPLNHDELKYAKNNQALEAVKITKEKIDGFIKGRTCENNSEKEIYLKEGEIVALPMVSLEWLLTTFFIDVCEGRAVATLGVLGAYLRVDIPKYNKDLLKFRGTSMDIIG